MKSNWTTLLVAAAGSMFFASACCGTSKSGNLVRANSRYANGNYTGTIELADFILGQGPVTPEIGAQAGLLKAISLERLGRNAEAIAIYRYIAENYRGSISGAQASGRLAELSKP